MAIPQFAIVKDRIATGQQPFLDGVTWLKKQSYTTVLYLRAPGEDDGAAQRLFTRSGLKYLGLEISPNTLTRETADRFIRIVNDESNLPIYVYDREGYLAPGLWYVYLRIHDGLSEEKAREEATRLGLRPDQDVYHRAMWNAVRQLDIR